MLKLFEEGALGLRHAHFLLIEYSLRHIRVKLALVVEILAHLGIALVPIRIHRLTCHTLVAVSMENTASKISWVLLEDIAGSWATSALLDVWALARLELLERQRIVLAACQAETTRPLLWRSVALHSSHSCSLASLLQREAAIVPAEAGIIEALRSSVAVYRGLRSLRALLLRWKLPRSLRLIRMGNATGTLGEHIGARLLKRNTILRSNLNKDYLRIDLRHRVDFHVRPEDLLAAIRTRAC